MLISAQEDRTHGIKDFLGRPVVLFAGPWATTDGDNSILPSSTLTFPQAIWSQPMWANKLRGFRFLKATLNFQIQVNASPFDQGRLWAFWSPFDAERDDFRPFFSRTNWTGYPGVEVDVGTKMTSELTIPYVSPFTHLDQTQPNQPYGVFRLGILSPFYTTNDPSVDVTVYCWLTDVDLAIPTDFATFGAQSGQLTLKQEYIKDDVEKFLRRRSNHFIKNYYDRFISITPAWEDLSLNDLLKAYDLFVAARLCPSCSSTWQAQSERNARSRLGVISGSAHVVGSVAKMLANTPGVAAIAKPAAWIADAVKGTAEMVGLSKPVSDIAITTISNVPAKSFTNYDGLDNSIVLGTSHKNEVSHQVDLMGTTEDEMNIPYVIGKFNYIQKFNWPMTAAAKASPLFKLPIHAGICGTDVVPDATGTYYTPTHMSYVASMHRLWRGSIDIRFSAVKNQYYSGRLIFVYYPGMRAGDVIDYNTLDVNACSRWIWDIKEDGDLTLNIPYNSNTQYLRVLMHNNASAPSQEGLTVDTITGTLVVFVDNSLRGPPTVPDNFWIIVSVCGGSDMSFAIPDMTRFGPYHAVPTAALLPSGFGQKVQPKIKVVDKKPYIQQAPVSNTWKAQMLHVEETYRNPNQTEIGKDKPEGSSMLQFSSKENIKPEEFCAGEIINNLRPLTRRFALMHGWLSPGSSSNITLDPAFNFPASASLVRHPLNYLARMYVFYRGSVRYKIVVAGENVESLNPNSKPFGHVTSSELVSTSPRDFTVVPADVGDYAGGRFTHVQNIDLNQFVEVTCPYYSNTPLQIVSKAYITSNHLRMIYKFFTNSDNTVAGSSGNVYKAGGDDFTFGYLVGAPLLLDYGQV